MNVSAVRGLTLLAACVAISAFAEDLSVTSANSPYVIDADATYGVITIGGGGELIVTNGAALNVGTLTVGNSGSGTMTVTDGSTVTVTDMAPDHIKDLSPLRVGFGTNTSGTLNLLDGSSLTANFGIFSYLTGAKSYVTISNSQLTVANTVWNTRNAADGRPANPTNSIIRLEQGGAFTVNTFIRNSPGSTTLFQFVGGVLTNKANLSSLDGGWLVLEGVGGHPIDYTMLAGSGIGYFTLDGGTASFGTPHVHLTGNGGVRFNSNNNRKTVNITGTVPVPTAVTSDYTGDCVVLGRRLTQTAPNQVFSKKNRIVLNGIDGATSVLDLNGFDAECAGIVESNRCYVLNPGNMAAVTLTVGGDGNDSELNSLLCQSPVTVRKRGAGTLDLYSDDGADNAPALTVEEGNVNLHSRSTCGYKAYKWIINDTYGKNPKQDYVRMGELEMFDKDGRKVDFSQMIGGQNCDNLVDGNVQSDQFFDRTKVECAVNREAFFVISFANPVQVASYRWATGYDYGTETKFGGHKDKTDLIPPAYDVSMCRDPSDWTVYGSNDGYNWVEIGKVTEFKAPNNRWTWGPTFELDYAAPLLSGALKVSGGATLNVIDGRRLNCTNVVNEGTINYAVGTILGVSGAGLFLDPLGTGNGSAAIEKTGADMTTVFGTGAATGSVKVAAGTLALGANGGVTNKYWRWRVKGMREWWYDPAKWAPGNVFPGGAFETDIVFASELALYDKDGNRVNVDADGTTVVSADVTHAKTGFQSLLDNNLNTKLWLYFEDRFGEESQPRVPRILRDDPATWKGFVFKLPDNAKPVFSYDIMTGADHSDRDPAAWDFAVSDDGVNWTIIEDYAEADVSWYVYNLKDTSNPTGRHAWGTYNHGERMKFYQGLVPAPADQVCYAADADVSVGSAAKLALPGATTVTGSLVIDATQTEAGTLSHFNLAEVGTVDVVNFTNFAGSEMALPFACENVENAENLANWTLKLNGIPSKRFLLEFRKNGLYLVRRGFSILIK